MSEWWTYRPSDFVMFSPRSYAALWEQYNRDAWPAHLPMLMLAVALLWWIRRPPPSATRIAAVVLALIWAWVGWGFHWSRYAQINTAAPYLAAAFWLQSLGLMALAAIDPAREPGWEAPRAAAVLVFTGALLWPLLVLVMGRNWIQAETFGLAPDPTAVVTLGWLLAAGRLRLRAWAAVIPVLSLAAGLMTNGLLYGDA
jgi:hypothetical protein